MTLSERWLASEQRHSMSYERWLEYVVTDAELDAQRYRKLRLKLNTANCFDELFDLLTSDNFDEAVDALPEPK